MANVMSMEETLIVLILGDEARIVEAISAGAGYEVWMQVEFVLLCRANEWSVAREVPYGNGTKLILDFLLGRWQQRYAVELKVESARNAGKGVLLEFVKDVEKLALYHIDELAGRYAVAIAYSDEANKRFAMYVTEGPNRSYKRLGAIGVLVENVPVLLG
jgi:hypothetical protein